ncbi:MAG: UDP-N-acetylglucosamine 2-epimerase (non-hydrolyzing) [Planctomycetes bacterium]|nr:UDP-N-acetylglucosamine 2-epimerase (non-hydrolyzing) [Planctomycetota bacterium]
MSLPVVLSLIGTRPEAIKLAPVLRALEARPGRFRSFVALTGQHRELVEPFVRLFAIRPDHDLEVGRNGQTPADVARRVLESLGPLLERMRPDLLLVQGDTTSALAGALAGFYQGVPVGHVEAGLRSGDPLSPFPEEMNRRLISRLAAFHFAATEGNRRTLLAEGVDEARIAVTGNPVVDALHSIAERLEPSPEIARVVEEAAPARLLVLTTHRRESFGATMEQNLRALRDFAERHDDAVLVFPVHPNPRVQEAAQRVLGSRPLVRLLPPLGYLDFIYLLSRTRLIVSDSGGVQEEAPTLRKPLLILRENTERPEAVAAGVARLVGAGAGRLRDSLEEAWADGSWADHVSEIENPFGDGRSGERIAEVLPCMLAQVRR